MNKIIVISIFLISCCVNAQSVNLPKQIQNSHEEINQRMFNEMAMDWTKIFVSNNYLPPVGAQFLCIPASSNTDIDVVKIKYQIDENIFTITQTLCGFFLEICTNEELNLKKVESMAQKVLKNAKSLTFKSTNADLTEGISVSAERPAPQHWLNTLHWNIKGKNTMLIYFIKDDGMPSALDKGFDDSSNKNWFKMYNSNMKNKRSSKNNQD